MGIIRKTISASTLGAVDFRSDKERIARSTRQTKNAVKAQTRAIKAQTRAANAQADRLIDASQQPHQTTFVAVPPVAAPIPLGPGWFTDLVDPNFVRWHDGWGPTDVVHYVPVGTSHTAPLAAPPDHLVTGSHRPVGAVPIAPPAAIAPMAPPAAAPDVASQLERLADLHRQGVLSDDEFAAAKQRLLS